MQSVRVILLGALLTGLGACSGVHETKPDGRHSVPAAPLPDTPRLDVPGLLTLTVDELGQRIGPALRVPPTFQDPTLAPLVQQRQHLDSTVLFQYRGLNMVASFDYRTRKVSDLLLLGRNEEELMSRCQLLPTAKNYLVLPVFEEHRPTQLMGLRVLATPQ